MKQSLLIISYSPIVSDARVIKQVKLFKGRYDVTTCGYGEAPEGVVRHFQIPDELVYWKKDKKLLLLRQYAKVYSTQEVTAYLRPILEGMEFDVVLVDDLDPVPFGLFLKPKGGLHVDLHEFSPAQKAENLPWRLAVAPYLRWLIRRFVTQADSVTTVCQGVADLYEKDFGITPGIVQNATPFHDLIPTPVASRLRLVHSGACLRSRHLDLLIEAVNKVKADVTFDLYLTPNDPGYLAELKEMSGERVRILDPVPYAELIPTINAYDVGIYMLPPVNANHENALPNKFFDFVQARLALVFGPSKEMVRIINDHDLGLVTDDFSSDALARAIDSLDVAQVEAFKAATHRAARALSAEEQEAGWLEPIDALAQKARR